MLVARKNREPVISLCFFLNLRLFYLENNGHQILIYFLALAILTFLLLLDKRFLQINITIIGI